MIEQEIRDALVDVDEVKRFLENDVAAGDTALQRHADAMGRAKARLDLAADEARRLAVHEKIDRPAGPQPVSIGRIVHYNAGDRIVAGIVTAVEDCDVVSLTLFAPDADDLWTASGIAYGADEHDRPTSHCWCYPRRV